MKRIAIIAIPLLIIAVVAYWLATHAYLSITVDSTQPGEANIVLVDQSTGATTTVSTTSGQIKRLMKRGSYEVLASQSENHAFARTTVGGFLGNNELRLRVEAEGQRSFVGNEPLPCMGLAGSTLFSLACGDSVRNVQLHIPASTAQPTFTQKLPSPLAGFVEGSVQTAEGTLLVIKAPNNSEEQGPPHGVYALSASGLRLLSALDELEDSTYYSVAPHKTGFVAYNIPAGELYYFESAKASAESLSVPSAENALVFYSLASFGEQVAITYSTKKGEEPGDVDQAKGVELHSEVAEEDASGSPRSQIVLASGQNQRVYQFDFAPERVRLCGQTSLCVLKEDGELLIYDASTDKQKLLYTLKNVLSIHNLGESFVVVRTKEIVKLDIGNQKGSVLYSFGDNDFCGLQSAGAITLVCIVNSKDKRAVLALNAAVANTDSIDKKVAELLKSSSVKDVSAYGNLLYVSPELGKLSFQESTGGFGYDPALTKQTAMDIDEAVKRIGFGANYTIINPYR